MNADLQQTVVMVVVAVVVIALWQFLRRRGFAPEAEAVRRVAEGARVVDVRTPGEFAAGHLDGVVNVPLGGVVEGIGAVAPDRAAPLLLHCHSGGRSAVALMQLRRAGYTNVLNLGSYGRAERILRMAGGARGSGRSRA